MSNIYLIFIVPDQNSSFYAIDIQNDFQYARKIILLESEANNFFNSLFQLSRKGEKNTLYMAKAMKQKEVKGKLQYYLKESVDLLMQEATIRYFLYENKGKKKVASIPEEEILYLISSCVNYDGKNVKSKNRREKFTASRYNLVDSKIQQISGLRLTNYRRFEQPCEIKFRKVNLLFGDNGVGKTSILDAIELGITGFRHETQQDKSIRNASIEVQCIDSNQRSGCLAYKENNLKLSEAWYGIRAEKTEDFNKLFNQYNYFDTSWASAFAIEGEEQVNIRQLQEFLGIDDLEDYEKKVGNIYEKIKQFAETDEKYLSKNRPSIDWRRCGAFKYKKNGDLKMYEQNKRIIEACNSTLEKLKKEIEIVAWRDLISEHIINIERIFKLLVCSDEYVALKIEKEEIVAIRSGSEEKVRMSEMSTGQKVCLALAFMFALFLSNETAPNFILLDEPAANLDDLHMLNLLDLLRRLSLSGTQIFFTTANPNVAKLFRRKFSYLEKDFGFYRIIDGEKNLKINYEQYTQKQEEPIEVVTIYGK